MHRLERLRRGFARGLDACGPIGAGGMTKASPRRRSPSRGSCRRRCHDPPRHDPRTTPTSPYGRKVRIAALARGLADRIEIIPADTADPSDDLRMQDTLGKMPRLLVGDQAIHDARHRVGPPRRGARAIGGVAAPT